MSVHGLTSEHWKQIYRILEMYRDRIRKVMLFGSRARGDYHKTSDVDLAIVSDFDLRAALLAGFEARAFPIRSMLFFMVGSTIKDYGMRLTVRGNSCFALKEEEFL